MGLFRRKRSEDPVDPEDRSPATGLRYKDLAVLGQLVKAGAQLEQPRHARYFLYFRSRADAERAGQDVLDHEFEVEVRDPLPNYPGLYALVCERHGIVLDTDTVRDNSDYFASLADRFQGEYDGWEASVRS